MIKWKTVRRNIIIVIECIITFFCMYKSIFYGCDIDESYAISLSYRLLQGDHLFKEMWEIHQTSSLFMVPFIWIYRIVNGTTIGMVVYLRTVGTLIQIVFAIFLYNCLKYYLNYEQRSIITLIFLNFSPKYSQVLEFSFLHYLFSVGMIIGFLYYFSSKKHIYLCVAGLFQACTILAYPQIILVIPIEIIGLIVLAQKKKIKWIEMAYLIGTEVLCGLLFLMYIFINITFKEFVDNILYILSDGSHQETLYDKALIMLNEIQMYVVPLFFGIILFEITFYFARYFQKICITMYLIEIFLFCSLLYSLVPLILKRYVGVCHLDLAYPILYVYEALAYIFIRFKKQYNDTNFTYLIIILSLSFVSCCFASNLPLYANAVLLLPTMLVMWIFFLKTDFSFENNDLENNASKFAIVPLMVFCLYILLARSILIRFTSVQRKYIFDTYYTIGVGTEKGIKVNKDEHIRYHSRYQAIIENVTANDALLIFGTDSYFYFFTGSKISAPSTISTPVYDEKILDYYYKYPYKQPTIILIDKFNQSLDNLLDIPKFGEWISENFDINGQKDYAFYTVIYKKE